MKRSAIISWIAVFLWMAVIFALSAQPATESNRLSKGITEAVIDTIEKVVPIDDVKADAFNNILRKNAHFFAYLLLGGLVLNALRVSWSTAWANRVMVALLICALYAVSDEIHQIFVPGRGAQVKDVLIDISGAVFGVALSYGIWRIFRKERGSL